MVAVVLLAAACSSGELECEPLPCSSCALGYYGPAVAPDASYVRVASDAPTATATAWLWIDGARRELHMPTLPALVELPAGTTAISATTSRGSISVAACTE